jgi:D-amino-acid dehydrogenase
MQRAGLQVTIIDRGDDKAAASYGNAGHLATEQCDPLASPANVRSLHRRLFLRGGPVSFPLRDITAWLPFGWRLLRAASPALFAHGQRAMGGLMSDAIGAWQRLATTLGVSEWVRSDGHFVVWESEASAQRGLASWMQANTGSARARPAAALELSALRTRFGDGVCAAARFSNTGQIVDLAAMRRALRAAFETAGGTVRHANVRGLDHATARLDDGTIHKADCVIVAAGIGSANLLASTYGAIPLIAERGYHVQSAMDGRTETPDGIPVVFEDRNVIIAPFASSLRLSGFTEFSRADAPPDARKWETLERHALQIGLFKPGAQCERWMGARPTLPDYLPAIGQLPAQRNVFYAFGHNHLGVTLAATTAELLTAHVCGRTPAIDLASFSLQRFRSPHHARH